jgi:glycerol dehydrogenase-like iron-containing ADH family enzyme
LGNDFFHSLEEHQIEWKVNRFAGESSESNILHAMQAAHECNADMIIGVGGGKSLDTAKVAASDEPMRETSAAEKYYWRPCRLPCCRRFYR